MASQGDTVVTTQPRSKRHELEKFVRDLDPTEVVGRSKQCKCSDSLELLPSDRSCMYIRHYINIISYRCYQGLLFRLLVFGITLVKINYPIYRIKEVISCRWAIKLNSVITALNILLDQYSHNNI